MKSKNNRKLIEDEFQNEVDGTLICDDNSIKFLSSIDSISPGDYAIMLGDKVLFASSSKEEVIEFLNKKHEEDDEDDFIEQMKFINIIQKQKINFGFYLDKE